ncbi:MAG: DUF4339 domain-containing protein [Acidobacteria bacterium]|nr:DUF4339 domain-containing protein [Acidobacteriota bacterium]
MSETPVYFAVVDGQQQGPLPREALAAWYREGRLRPEDLVWESGTPDWIPASALFGTSSLADVPLAAGPAAGRALGPLPPPIARAKAKAGAVLRDLASLPAEDVLPFGRLRDPETLGAPAAWPLLVFGLAPLLLVALVEDAAWRVRLFHLGCGAAWTVFFWRGFSDDVPPRGWGPAFLSGAALASILFFAFRVPPLSWLAAGLGNGRSLLANTLSAGALGLVWAGAVALVLVLLMGGRGSPAGLPQAVRSDRPGGASAGLGLTLGLFLGVGAGVASGVLTAGGFSRGEAPSLASVLAAPSLSLYAALVTTVVKVSLLPVLQGAWGAASGVFAGSFLAEGRRPAFLVVGLAIPALLFGLFELSVARTFWPGTFLVAAVSLLGFLAWRRAATVTSK